MTTGQRWDAARAASERRTPQRRVIPPPVGDPALRAEPEAECPGCGYQECSCVPNDAPPAAPAGRATHVRREDFDHPRCTSCGQVHDAFNPRYRCRGAG